MPYTPRPQSPIGWVRLGIQVVALAAFLVALTNWESHRTLALGLILSALCVNLWMFLLNYRAARRAGGSPKLPGGHRRTL
jgi:riboflavin transporter FmnP